jgi:phospholipase/lecithinase/hemolysin
MRSFARFSCCLLLFGLAVFPARAAFTSFYVFGDGVSTTTSNAVAGQLPYYGLRKSNGRVWVELLAQQLGLPNNFWYSNNIANNLSYTNLSASSTNWSYSSNNWSYYYDDSPSVIANLKNFASPTNASNALFIVWVSDADFVDDMGNIYGANSQNSARTNITLWTNAINLSLSNHWQIITNLYYAKNARTLLMPDAVDITEVPQYDLDASGDKAFIRQMVIDFNTNFTALLSNAEASCPGLKIYEPDFFTLLDNILTNATAYGLTNALYDGQSIDVLEDPTLSDNSVNGPGTDYIFWDATDPTAKAHAIMAGVARQLLVPVQFSRITPRSGTNQLTLANVPIGLNGFVLGSTNLALTNWTTVTSVNSTNNMESVTVPVSGPMQFYQLYFPFSWTWP